MPLANYVKHELGLDFAYANNLEVKDGKLTGQTYGPIVDSSMKLSILQELMMNYSIPRENVLAVGDGANDIPMLKHAGLGIAFNAKKKVQEQIGVCINQPNLVHVLYVLGMSDEEIEKLDK
jgi:phosphoserine phosphatase SerB